MAHREFQVFSPQAVLTIATYENMYVFKEDYFELHLGKELSSRYFFEGKFPKKYRYILTILSYSGEILEENCLLLPEVGNWSIEKIERIESNHKYILADSVIVVLKCSIFNSDDKFYYKYSPRSGFIEINLNGTIYKEYGWPCWHYGNRPSIEDLCHIRFERNSLYKKAAANKKFEIFLVRDRNSANDFTLCRLTDQHDDIYFYHNDNTNKNYPANFTCFIVPRIFFVKFEESSLSIDIRDHHSPIHFTLIVQQFENPEKTVWDYHRLEIVREESAHEIQINDLGPVPRSEWEPGWSDPATTPLWKEPESDCAQCQ